MIILIHSYHWSKVSFDICSDDKRTKEHSEGEMYPFIMRVLWVNTKDNHRLYQSAVISFIQLPGDGQQSCDELWSQTAQAQIPVLPPSICDLGKLLNLIYAYKYNSTYFIFGIVMLVVWGWKELIYVQHKIIWHRVNACLN